MLSGSQLTDTKHRGEYVYVYGICKRRKYIKRRIREEHGETKCILKKGNNSGMNEMIIIGKTSATVKI